MVCVALVALVVPRGVVRVAPVAVHLRVWIPTLSVESVQKSYRL